MEPAPALPLKQIPLRPDRARVSARLARRTLSCYLLFFILGLVPLLLDMSPGWQAFGIGLWFPGGGFLAQGGWGLAAFVASLLCFGLAWFLWFFMGAFSLVPGVWLMAAVIAGLTIEHPISAYSPYVAALLSASFIVQRKLSGQKRVIREMEKREQLNAILPDALTALEQRAAPAQKAGTRELTEEQLKALRYAYDRALQPLDRFDGFNIIDQFRESAIRYQLNKLGYALALAQCHYLPNFHGYLSQAQRNFIEKFQDKRVWGYWQLENLLGNLSLNPDPIGKGNIMFGGFFNANLSFYTANTGDRRYLEPGSLTFPLNNKTTFQHDMKTIAANSRENFSKSPFTLYPCEPTHSFSYCNLLGLTSLPVNDRIFNSYYAQDLVGEFRTHFENEFMDADGGIIASRNNTTGLRFQSFDALWTRAGYCWLINGHFPDLSEQIWAIIREQEIRFDQNGELIIDLSGWMDRLDCGNYKFTGPMPYVQLMLAAAEHGDREVADAALRGLDKHHNRSEEGGVLYYPNLSNFAAGLSIMGRILQRHDWRNMIHHGPAAETFNGPVLANVRYPDVQVAKAWSNGEDLDLVLYPGTASSLQEIAFERLRIGGNYLLKGVDERTLTADERGQASVTINLHGRTELQLVPLH
jgi:Linalool dehydratase/isomerase